MYIDKQNNFEQMKHPRLFKLKIFQSVATNTARCRTYSIYMTVSTLIGGRLTACVILFLCNNVRDSSFEAWHEHKKQYPLAICFKFKFHFSSGIDVNFKSAIAQCTPLLDLRLHNIFFLRRELQCLNVWYHCMAAFKWGIIIFFIVWVLWTFSSPFY